jgi:hypothetical protein
MPQTLPPPTRSCRQHVEGGGTTAWPCWLPEGHAGPCAAKEIPASMRRRATWEAQNGVAQPPPETQPADAPVEPDPLSHAAQADPPPVDVRASMAEQTRMCEAHGYPHPDWGPGCYGPGQKKRDGDQELPVPNDQPLMHDALVALIEDRKQTGIKRYGTPLQPFNGRDPFQDAVEEIVDAGVYLLQCQIEWGVLTELAERANELIVGHDVLGGLTAVQEMIKILRHEP